MSDGADVVKAAAHHRIGVILLFHQIVEPNLNLKRTEISKLDAGNSSAYYIHLYHGNAALLTESLEVIQKTSALILSAIETKQVEAEQTEALTKQNATDASLAEVA